MNNRLAIIAEQEARKCYHGVVIGLPSTIEPIVSHFSGWTIEEADRLWCSAFVYHCVVMSGLKLPPKLNDERISCSFAGCKAWDQWAKLPENQYFSNVPERGALVLFNDVFSHQEHDHIGIVLEVRENAIIVAEGNVGNVSAIVERALNNHIRGYVNIPEVKNEKSDSN